MITEFTGPHWFLSNFSPSPLVVGDNTFPTIEHYFQAHKSRSASYRVEVAAAATPGDAKRLGRQVPLREDWEAIKLTVMRRALSRKFGLETALAGKLIRTQHHLLVEGNNWGDKYWGCAWNGVEWDGQNWLGWLLMAQRSFLLTR